MPGLNRAAHRFLEDYRGRLGLFEAAAELARDVVSRLSKETGALVHVTSARAKTPDSLRGKFRHKRYARPSSQVTDLIGVRVITYYRDDVDRVVTALREGLEIDSKNSVDKRQSLGLRGFGYRSVHLIARARPVAIASDNYKFLQRHWFEIQVRSVLEHAWAEIEHEVVYKSGIKQPDDVLRRFAALAGSLELFDGEFQALREERKLLISNYTDKYRARSDWRTSFDVARLLGYLNEYRRKRHWPPFEYPSHAAGTTLEAACVDALKSAHLGTPASLSALFQTHKYRRALNSFASLKGIAPSQVSALGSVIIAIAVKDAKVLRDHFPEILFDVALNELVETRARRPQRRRR